MAKPVKKYSKKKGKSPTRTRSKSAVRKAAGKKAVKRSKSLVRKAAGNKAGSRKPRVQKTDSEQVQRKRQEALQREALKAQYRQRAEGALERKQQARLQALLASGWTPSQGSPLEGMKILGFDANYGDQPPRINSRIQVVDDYLHRTKSEGRFETIWTGTAIAPSEESLKMWLHSLGQISTYKGEDLLNIEDLEVKTGPKVRKQVIASLYGLEFFLQLFPEDAGLIR